MGGSISNENTRTNITISKELKAQLEELAKQDNRSFNNYVITVLKEHVENLNK
jgi:predicted HicB family RNase H-like nuclease